MNQNLAFVQYGDWADFEFEGLRGSKVEKDDCSHVRHLEFKVGIKVSRLGNFIFSLRMNERRQQTTAYEKEM